MLKLIHGIPYISSQEVCELCDISLDDFARICFDPQSPSVCISRVQNGDTFIETSCCRVLLLTWHPEKVAYFDAYFSSAKRTLTASEKKNVAMLQQWKCKMCNNLLQDFEVDHVEQRCIRNQNTYLQALCPSCHRKKTRLDQRFADALFEPIQSLVGQSPAHSVFEQYMFRN